MTGASGLAAPAEPVAGLLLPVDGPSRVIRIAADVTPGGWPWPARWVDTIDGHQVVWCGERRNVAALPANASAWMLAARLGCADLADRIGLNGDLLLACIGRDGRAADVPDVVVQAAQRAGLHHRLPSEPVRPGCGARAGVLKAGRA